MQSKRKIFLSCLIALSACSGVLASDWVDDERVSDFQAPRRNQYAPVPQDDGSYQQQRVPRRPRYQQPPPETQQQQDDDDNGASVQVRDQHGGTDNAPIRKKNNVLQGNVNKFGLNSQQNNYQPSLGQPGFGMVQQEPSAIHYPPAKEAIVESKTFKAWLDKTHPELKGTIDMQRDAIVEVRGQWDDSGHALRTFGMTCSKVAPDKLSKYDLTKTKILIVDCAGNVPQDGLEAIRKFVAGGGYLLTTDWALEGCVQKAIPGFIEWNGDNTSESKVVDAWIKTEDPSLTQGTVPRAHWKLDKKCQIMRIIKPYPIVEVLVASVQLKAEDSSQVGALAASFRFGKGRVLHLVGHFDYNSDRAFNNLLPDPAPQIGISLRQAIAANFVAEALGQGGSAPAVSNDRQQNSQDDN